MTAIRSTEFLIEVARGNWPGIELVGFQAQGEVDETLGDLWGGNGDMVYPTSAETWEIVSDSANDSAAGSGLRTGVVLSLDESFNEQVTPFTMNGTTPVTLANTHYRPRSIEGVFGTSGSTGANEGEITLRVQGGGAVRNVMKPGKGASYDGHFTVPAGKQALILSTINAFPVNSAVKGFAALRNANVANSTWVSGADIPLYQSLRQVEVFAKFPVPSGFDIKNQVQADSGTFQGTIIYEYLLVDTNG